jgi:hypothetical protein
MLIPAQVHDQLVECALVQHVVLDDTVHHVPVNDPRGWRPPPFAVIILSDAQRVAGKDNAAPSFEPDLAVGMLLKFAEEGTTAPYHISRNRESVANGVVPAAQPDAGPARTIEKVAGDVVVIAAVDFARGVNGLLDG